MLGLFVSDSFAWQLVRNIARATMHFTRVVISNLIAIQATVKHALKSFRYLDGFFLLGFSPGKGLPVLQKIQVAVDTSQFIITQQIRANTRVCGGFYHYAML